MEARSIKSEPLKSRLTAAEKRQLKKIKEHLKIEEENNYRHVIVCPFCKRKHPSFELYTFINSFQCQNQKCKVSGDYQQLIDYLGIDGGKKANGKEYIYYNMQNLPLLKVFYSVQRKKQRVEYFTFFNNRWMPKGLTEAALYNMEKIKAAEKILFVDSEEIADNINTLLEKNKVQKVTATTNAGGYSFREKGDIKKILKDKTVYVCLRKTVEENLPAQHHALWLYHTLDPRERERAKIIDPGFADNQSLDEYLAKNKISIKKFIAMADLTKETIPEIRLWQDLMKPKKSEEKNNVQIILERLEENIDLRYNEILLLPEYKNKYDKKFLPMDKYQFNTISLDYMMQYTSPRLTDDLLTKLINSNYIEKVNPFKDYFNSLPEWDGKTDYIRRLADLILLEDESEREIFRKYFKKFMVSVASTATWHRAGHYIFVLGGAGGIGKTRFITSLVPPKLKDYVNASYVDFTNKRNDNSLINLARMFFIVLDEIDKYDFKNFAAIKSYATQDTASFRSLYDQNVKSHKRSASFPATTNKRKFLYNDPGNRRLLVFWAKKILYQENFMLDHVWSQSYALLKSGFQYWANEIENEEIMQRLTPFFFVSYEEEVILRFFKLPTDKTPPEKIIRLSATEIVDYLKDKTSIPLTANKVGRIMANLNIQSKSSRQETDNNRRYTLEKVPTNEDMK